MNTNKIAELIRKYETCPRCGGCGWESLKVHGDRFERVCECGNKVSVKENDNE